MVTVTVRDRGLLTQAITAADSRVGGSDRVI
jgi:hypothetical protein